MGSKAADDFFDFELQEVTFCGEEGAIASVVGDAVLEAVDCVVADDFGECW